jgi:hypothetical protein
MSTKRTWRYANNNGTEKIKKTGTKVATIEFVRQTNNTTQRERG